MTDLRRVLILGRGFLMILALGFGASCTKPAGTASSAPVNLQERGRAVYMANCIACHNVNPKLDGSVGPAVFGSSLDLVQARVLKASYPEGYKPKRTTSQMPAFPHLEKEIPALVTFLNENPEK